MAIAKNILNMKKNQPARIKEMRVDNSAKRRLLDIGLTKGACIQYKGKAPLGDPILINLRGVDLALRKADAAKIFIDD